MIVAYGILILSIFIIAVLIYAFIYFTAEKVKEENIVLSILVWFVIGLFSAQYIWMGY